MGEMSVLVERHQLSVVVAGSWLQEELQHLQVVARSCPAVVAASIVEAAAVAAAVAAWDAVVAVAAALEVAAAAVVADHCSYQSCRSDHMLHHLWKETIRYSFCWSEDQVYPDKCFGYVLVLYLPS